MLISSIFIVADFRINSRQGILQRERSHSTTIASYKHLTANYCAPVPKRRHCGQFSLPLNSFWAWIDQHFDLSVQRRYIEKDIGALISEDPFTVRLKFEPAGRAVGETGEYYRTPKANQCVVCGESEKYIRKNVVPREYRKYFPCKLSFVEFRTQISNVVLIFNSKYYFVQL